MKFDLTQEGLDQVIFGMENQEIHHFFDSHTLRLVEETEALALLAEDTGSGNSSAGPDEDAFSERFLPLPEWRSVDGYNLMEGFVSSLRNPLYRENLRHILQSGKGVFRQFKDALKERKDIERLWFRFKQKEMRRRVLDWYNDLREFWGLEPLSVEEEVNTEELLLSDFDFSLGSAEQSGMLAEWDYRLFEEMFPDATPDEREFQYELRRVGLPLPGEMDGSVALLSRTPTGEIAGFLWAMEGTPAFPRTGVGEGEDAFGHLDKVRIARVLQIGVMLEYRGLGMGMALLKAYQKMAEQRNIDRILIEVTQGSEFFGRGLLREGFVTKAVTYEFVLKPSEDD